MNIIITDSKLNYNGFLKLRDLKSAVGTHGNIDFLVYYRSNESDNDKIRYLNQLKDRVGKMIYIRDRENVNMVVKIFVLGCNGKYFSDEFFLTSENENDLMSLVNNLSDITALSELGGSSVLNDFLNRYLKNGKSDSFSKSYLLSVKEAVQNLIEDYHSKSVEVIKLSETATEIFSGTSEVLDDMKEEFEKMKDDLKTIQNTSYARESQNTLETRSSRILFYPRISYLKEKRIVRIKDLYECQYLISFALGYRLYMETVKNVRPKLIIIEPQGDLYEKVYSGYNWVTMNNLNDKKHFYNNIVFTNIPNKEVLTLLLDDNDFDFFIVVDRTRNDENHILNSKGPLYYAVRSGSMVDKYKLKNYFGCGCSVSGGLFSVVGISDYPEEKSIRERTYLRVHENNYKLLG